MMQQIKYGMTLLVLVMIQGCATNHIPVIADTHTDVKLPEPIHYTDIDFKTYAGMQCLTMEDYKNLAENMLEVKRYIQQNRIIISEHNKLYDGDNKDE